MRNGSQIQCLSDALSFRVSRFAAINEHLGSKHFRDEFGLSLSEWRVLGLVQESDPATTASVRATLLMDRGFLSRVVKGLRTRGLLISQTSATDKRQTELLLTVEGKELHQAGMVFTRERNQAMASALKPSEQAEFGGMLDMLIAANAKRLTTKDSADE